MDGNMEIKYPNKTKWKGKNADGVVPIEMTKEQKHWYEIGFMCGYADAIENGSTNPSNASKTKDTSNNGGTN